jgi:predicted HTH domain antitoxin
MSPVLEKELLVEAAIELFKEGEVSLARAAERAGTDVMTFRKLLADRGVPVVVECDTPEVMDADIAAFFKE